MSINLKIVYLTILIVSSMLFGSTESNFQIHFAEIDSAYARIAKIQLEKKYDEIAYDFDLATNDTFSVIIVSSRKEFQQYLKGRLPNWTGAFASPFNKKMVIRSPRWSNDFLEYRVVLVHELLHLVMPHIVGKQEVPRWINEGMAIFYSGEERWKTSTALSKALSTNSYIPLQEIDDVLNFHRIQAELAYHESYSAIHYLLSIYDIDGLKTILYGIRDRKALDDIFISATGSSFKAFEKEWLAFEKKSQRYYWLSEFDNYLWILILVLVVLAVLVRNLKNRKTEQRWEAEQGQIEENESS